MYNRTIQKDVEKWLKNGKIAIIYGARQVGKTTLAKQIAKKYKKRQTRGDKNYNMRNKKK